MKALRVFSVESNHIGEIDGKFFKRNPHLEMVYLADNNLEEVSPVLFKHNSNLEFLHLDKNKITTLPTDLFGTCKLLTISLGGNQIRQLNDQAFKKCNKLVTVDLSDNELERLDSNVFRNSSQSLKKLNLIGNGKLKSSKGKKLCEDEKDENDNIKYSKCMLCSPDYVDTDKTCNMDKELNNERASRNFGSFPNRLHMFLD